MPLKKSVSETPKLVLTKAPFSKALSPLSRPRCQEDSSEQSRDFRKRGRRNGIASDFFRFLPFSPFVSFWLFYSGSDFFLFFLFLPFFRFLPFFPFSSVSFSETNGETPFARPLLRNPDILHMLHSNWVSNSPALLSTEIVAKIHILGARWMRRP